MSVIVSDRRTLIVGLGKTGLSCVRYLSGQGREIAVADSRLQPPGLDELKAGWPDVPIYLGEFDEELFAGFNELIVSPGISIAEPAIAGAAARGARIRGDIDLFADAADAPIIAITGSNGKTTVTTLVGEMARAAGRNVQVGGNIGTPALDLLDQGADLYVLELSSFQLETTEELGALAATVLNVSDDHMDRYPDKMAYFQAKQRIYRGCKNAIVNLDDALSTPMARDTLRFLCFGFNRVNPETFSTRDDDQGTWITWGLDNLLLASELQLMGRHNISNVMAALALGHAAGLAMEPMLEVARSFRGLPHRCEFVRNLNGVDYINDSKGTNVGATVAAIESLVPDSGKVILIAGGDGKGADFQPLAEPVAACCRALVLIGRDAGKISEAVGVSVPQYRATSLQEAVSLARQAAEPGDRVLLSPACASFDMFRDYNDRGEQFRALVEGL
ncbi:MULTISPECIES: UDP-N-acetylmuramoyl-L-alanine--D-glutamate ligase [Marinobacter]|jgi:UDP-N-acetylmuramoylalanine--D-glutamate ligase|uniref:UDP-N-acetylmuramoylalanine--D-glutamate ligase n=1 Tax=Marinobacter nauticus TaxID=2743 RepID=A0A833N970_MARNT|nr:MULTISPECIES: UDP-N-acetylmuramoyl-L-alanine--D-glutamate ligase [Marinobacter]MEC8896973.1 UDP-N-acetylmuramoyl-L-alanine--D-glutamate ligase [Pseudomonadota bacterium]KAE8545257.1 UDP-N-acetylmuramoylalanine--D-glutamate ligase [Marinobacter nauticus]MAC23795.1 UDP-N-acetylmuramoyl-L-alanine--D-glutamate ligase [Marinobacter sp.]MAL34106.1 UDP-N-acetylmuramoyl-L-alanine--D-glutamate ligase [Marinobacter sp.]MCS5560586.1 UDP-N-acetylmuramoyl-L-alanine--D-glutamate ligase [Marinobacter naut|tara:strand:+ start:7884 stop:9224 length:1341 start_codon:yes stop_codon:yes gene_type:complete